MTHWGATVLLDGGRVSISTDAITFPPRFKYSINDHFLKVFVLSYLKFLCDSPLEITSPKPYRVYARFLKRMVTEDLGDIIREFSSYSDLILSEDSLLGDIRTRDTSEPTSSTRVWLDSMKNTPIFKEYHHWFITGDPQVLSYILSFLRFGKKIKYIDRELDAAAFRGWLQVEEKLDKLTFCDEDTASLRTIVAELVGPLGIDTLLPSFGSGKVSEATITDSFDKLAQLSTDTRLAYAFCTAKVAYYRGYSEQGEFGDLFSPVHKDKRSSAVARFKIVPKDKFKSRSICMEPNAYMYYQQAVLRWVLRSLDRSPIRRFVNLRDQSANRLAALHGSKYLSSDTIDLSSASDSVHIELVKRVFPADWLFYMLATRSTGVRIPDGTVRTVKKFAPMGSALCFPTQCIIFTAVCVYAYMALARGKTTGIWVPTRDDVRRSLASGVFAKRSSRSPFGKAFELPVVYGDDIICDTRCTDTVISILSRLGFDVNVDKSFTAAQSFRESCGVYAYQGEDVTPVQFRIPFLQKGKRWDAKTYASMLENINLMNSKGYTCLGTFWLSILREYGFEYPLPFVTDPNAFGLYTANKHTVQDRFLRHDYQLPDKGKSPSRGGCWQVTEELVQGIGPRKTTKSRPENLDLYRLDQWWKSRVGDLPTPEVSRSSSIRPQETRLVPVWARCE